MQYGYENNTHEGTYLLEYGWVWFYPGGIANILFMSRVREKYRVTFDSAMDNCFYAHKNDGKTL